MLKRSPMVRAFIKSTAAVLIVLVLGLMFIYSRDDTAVPDPPTPTPQLEAVFNRIGVTVYIEREAVPTAVSAPTLPAPAQPTPRPRATAVRIYPSYDEIETMVQQMTAAPVDVLGESVTYCHDSRRVWTAEEMQVTAEAFAAWEPTGLSFAEVRYSVWPDECNVLIWATDDPGSPYAGQASRGVLPGIQAYAGHNLAYGPYSMDVMVHEIGHVLGLGHTDGGVMNPVIVPGARPGPVEFQMVKDYWYGGK